MLGPTAFFEERVLFHPEIPLAVNQLLQAAVVATHDDQRQAENLFKQAHQLDRSCLHSYFALYKFYFYQGRLAEAESAVLAALDEAARQSGMPEDFHHLAQQSEQWNMYASEVRLFYLYTLKALAFIKLRWQQLDEAHSILSLLAALDPEDRSGASVVMSLAEAILEEHA